MLPPIAIFLVLVTLGIVFFAGAVKSSSTATSSQFEGACGMAFLAAVLVAFTGAGVAWLATGVVLTIVLIVVTAMICFAS